MKLDDYSKRAMTTMTTDHDYGDISPQLMAQLLGLADESGEVLGKVKKLLRDKSGLISDEDRSELLKELGDILWYVNSVSVLLGSSLEEVAQKNLDKLASRKERGVLKGSGDNR